MKVPTVIENYWDYGIVGVLLLFAFPVGHGLLYNLNLALWCIAVLCVVHEVNHRHQEIKKAKTYWMMSMEKSGPSIDIVAYVLFSIAVIAFFVWLGVFA